jgi:hypothetical protein
LPNAKEVAFSDAIAVVLVPVPFNMTAWVEPESKENVALPVRFPVVLGVKENVKLAKALGASVTG